MRTLPAHAQFDEVRLWALSALAVVLLHSAALAWLMLRPQPRLRMRGSPQAIDVELSALRSSSSPIAKAPSETQKLPRPKPVRADRVSVADTTALQPFAEMQPIPQQTLETSATRQLSGAAVPELAPELAPVTVPQVATAADVAARSDEPSSAGQWLEEVKDQLARYKQYPRIAVKRKQQDTVRLRFSVDRAGHLTYVRIDSGRHYRPLEDEVRKMLQLAGPLPVPPAQVAVDQVILNVPVAFSLTPPRSVAAPLGCASPAGPGAAPTATTATLEQMNAYRKRLEQYVAASSEALKCGGPGTLSPAAREAQIRQLRTLVADFNAQLQAFEAKARAQALQAQRLRRRQVQAIATQTYSSCTAPMPISPPALPLTAVAAESYGQRLTAYQRAVRTYIACVVGRHVDATTANGGVPADLAAVLDDTAKTLTDDAIVQFNRRAVEFNAQADALRSQASRAGAQGLPETLVRAAAIFPDSTWNVPAPLPIGECLRIVRAGQGYRAELCRDSYLTRANASPDILAAGSNDAPGDAAMANATQIEAIAAEHGVAGDPRGAPPILGTTVAPLSQAGQQTASSTRVDFYTIKNLQVTGRRLSVTVSETSVGASGNSGAASSLHLQLALSPDSKELRGVCSTAQRRWTCALSRRP